MSAPPASGRTERSSLGRVAYEVSHSVAVLTIDNPPVNASSQAVRAGLLDGIRKAAADDSVMGVVIAGAGPHFVAGSDLSEFTARALPAPELPEVILAIEDCPKPVVAAMSGATLGGGLELALGCDQRVASTSSVLGFPEVTLGMVPGAGGTQRALRLIGVPATIALVTSGERLPVTGDVGRAFVDEVVEGDPLEAAVRRARATTSKRNLLEEPVPPDAEGAVESAARGAIASGRGTPEVIAAVGAVLAGLALPAKQALAHERAEFTRLRLSNESTALRYGFFARQATKRRNQPTTAVDLESVAVVGAGTMGRGIARAFIEAGAHVTIYDAAEGAANTAQVTMAENQRKLVQRGAIDDPEAEARCRRLKVAGSVADLGGHDLYIEAVFEEMEVKSSVLAALEEVAGDAPLATNTSYLDIDRLAEALREPDRLVGLHFFTPAHRTSVLEAVSTQRSSARAIDVALAAARLVGKLPIKARPGPGFIGNRIYNAYRWQCELMLEEGALPSEVDAAMGRFGFAMGPFAVWDMSGLDIAWRIRRAGAADRDPRARYPEAADVLCERGRLGQKTSMGWYRYTDGSRHPQPDTEVQEIIETISASKGITRRSFSAEEITRRALLAMANEASLLLAEGVAERTTDVDLMLVLGYGFPVRQGGIAFWATSQDRELLERELDELSESAGYGFRRGDLSLLGPDQPSREM